MQPSALSHNAEISVRWICGKIGRNSIYLQHALIQSERKTVVYCLVPKRNADVFHGHTSWESRLWASFWSLQLPPAVWEKLILLHGQPITFIILLGRLRIYHHVQLTGVFIRPPTACFFFRNEFSISSRRPTFSSWMDTKASISLESQTRFCLLKSQHKSAANHRQCNLFFEWGKLPLFGSGGSSCWAFGGWSVWFFLQVVGVAYRFGAKFDIFIRMKGRIFSSLINS